MSDCDCDYLSDELRKFEHQCDRLKEEVWLRTKDNELDHADIDRLKAELNSHIDTTADLQLSLRRVCEDRDVWKAKAEKMAKALKDIRDSASIQFSCFGRDICNEAKAALEEFKK